LIVTVSYQITQTSVKKAFGQDTGKNDDTTSSSKQNSQGDSISLPFPIPQLHKNEIKTTNDGGNHKTDNDAAKNSDNDGNNKNSKEKDSIKHTTPMHLPFP
jgi:hypothetical protein